jgi:hypothetical protein
MTPRRTPYWRRSRRVIAAGVLVLIGVHAAGGSPDDPLAARNDHLPAIWVGSPVDGRWPDSDGCPGTPATCSLPNRHHVPYGGDWAADIQGVGAGTAVLVYAAPENSSRAVIAKIEKIGNACKAAAKETAAQARSRGGEVVHVAFFIDGTKIGKAIYAHVDPSDAARTALVSGQPINRWGFNLGAVGRYAKNGCWTGVHLHFELVSAHAWACYNVGWSPKQEVRKTNFFGFVGGNNARAVKTSCPAAAEKPAPKPPPSSTPEILRIDGVSRPVGNDGPAVIHFRDAECDVVGGTWYGPDGRSNRFGNNSQNYVAGGTVYSCSGGAGRFSPFIVSCGATGARPSPGWRATEAVVIRDSRGHESARYSFDHVCN